MGAEMSYDQIYKALLSEGIEEYVPDGVSLSHPVVDFRDGTIVDCFLLFSISRDGLKYTVPTARILIDSEKKEVVEYKTAEEMPFSVYEGTDYFTIDIKDSDAEKTQNIECEYQSSYMKIRELAFKEELSTNDRETVVQYIKLLKAVELKNIQPFLFELGQPFFKWAKNAIRKGNQKVFPD